MDSRVESALSGDEIFYPPYTMTELGEIIEPRVERAFCDECIASAAVEFGVQEAAERCGDVRQLLRLFRQAGEHANEHHYSTVTVECIEASLERTEEEAVVAKLRSLPLRHLIVLAVSVS